MTGRASYSYLLGVTSSTSAGHVGRVGWHRNQAIVGLSAGITFRRPVMTGNAANIMGRVQPYAVTSSAA
jgi:hypothetical protein